MSDPTTQAPNPLFRSGERIALQTGQVVRLPTCSETGAVLGQCDCTACTSNPF